MGFGVSPSPSLWVKDPSGSRGSKPPTKRINIKILSHRDNLQRLVAGDIYEVGECGQGEDGRHEVDRVYVIKNGKRPLLIDSGSRIYRTSIMKSIEDILDGQTPEVLFLSHTELPHAGNVRALGDRWPGLTVVVSELVLAYLELPRYKEIKKLIYIPAGTERAFAGRELEFMNAILRDQTTSQWILDYKTGTMFSSDAFGYYHLPGKCELFNDEKGGATREVDMMDFHRNAFGYLRWVIPERFNETIDKVFENRDIKIIAPIHGNPIRSDINDHVAMLKRIIKRLRAESLGQTPVLTAVERGGRKK